MAKDHSILDSKIEEFLGDNPDVDCINLSLLKGIQKNDIWMIKIAIAAGANIYMDLGGDSEFIDLIANYLQDPGIKSFLMDVLLEDAIKADDADEMFFALSNGANRDLLNINDIQASDDYINSDLVGVTTELIGVQ